MPRLVDRYPNAPRLSAPSTDDPEHVYQLVEPYLDWQIAEIDVQSTDILLWQPAKAGDTSQSRRVIILGGLAVRVWLKHRKKR
jgi:hypothetical protein